MTVIKLNRAAAPLVRSERVTLGMAQLSPFGLSEQWVLRDCGDRHWGLIADRTGHSMAFSDAAGHPVYAAFCATSIEFHAAPALGQEVTLQSALFQVAPQRIGSLHQIRSATALIATVRMITCFLRHDETGSNRRLLRSSLPGLDDLPAAPEPLVQLHETSRGLARLARSAPIADAAFQYTPLTSLDFNAVGLLYFPVFSKIAEMAAPRHAMRQRTVVHLGNLDQGETTAVSPLGDHLLLHAGGRLIGIVETA